MENKNYTIKDIARMAGVSVGTVDRVLHDRGDVSRTSLEKVHKVLKEIDYRPNMFAIGLAAKKKYTFTCVIPYYEENDYWHAIAQGVERAASELRAFNVSIEYIRYRHSDEISYKEACGKLAETKTDAVLLAPTFREITLGLTARLDEEKIPYGFIDYNIAETNALIYIGQDSYMSGYIAGKMLMSDYDGEQEIALFLSGNRDNPAEIQMQRRMEGFNSYLSEEYPQAVVREVIFSREDSAKNAEVLDNFFRLYPKAELGVVFNSRVHCIGSYLKATGRKMKSLAGYDLLKKNTDLLRSGEVKYLIGQRPALQGYYGAKALCDHLVFKRKVEKIKYMPIDILMKENIDYYFELE